jgi:hypothetical protein
MFRFICNVTQLTQLSYKNTDTATNNLAKYIFNTNHTYTE